MGVVVHVAGCAGQGAVIGASDGWPEHDRREDVGAVDDGGGGQGSGARTVMRWPAGRPGRVRG